jgi:hypothetical protein
MQKPESQESIVKQMDAVGAFNQFLTTTLRLASLAEKTIETGEADKEDFLAGEA